MSGAEALQISWRSGITTAAGTQEQPALVYRNGLRWRVGTATNLQDGAGS